MMVQATAYIPRYTIIVSIRTSEYQRLEEPSQEGMRRDYING